MRRGRRSTCASAVPATAPEELRGKIWHMLAKNGSAMPHFSGRLTDAEARQVVAYLRATEIPPAAPGASPGPAHE